MHDSTLKTDWLKSVATVFLQSHKYDKARPLLELALMLYPGDPAALKKLAYLHFQKKEYRQAISYCHEYEHHHGNAIESRLFLLRSLCHQELKERELALTYFEKFSSSRKAL